MLPNYYVYSFNQMKLTISEMSFDFNVILRNIEGCLIPARSYKYCSVQIIYPRIVNVTT